MPILAFRPVVIAAREILQQGRARLAAQHAAKSPGIQVSAALTEMFDQIVTTIFHGTIADLTPAEQREAQESIALVALGGYGRSDVAPYSDVDLMLLHQPRSLKLANRIAKQVIQDLYDAGLIAGQSLRTVEEAIKLAKTDASIFTSLIETRYLLGNAALLERLERKLLRATQSRWRSLLPLIMEARDKEREQFGETVHLLEPNVKRSPGALRDLQLIRWIGYTRYGNNDPESLHLLGELHQEDRDALRRAREFLLHVRNELHFHHHKPHDVLNKVEQVRIAELFGYQPRAGLLPVELFMQEYFRHTQAVKQIATRFLEGAQPYRRLQEWLGPLISFSLDGKYRVGPNSITATRQGQIELQQDLANVLRLAVLASVYNKRIAHSTWKLVRDSVVRFRSEVTPQARQQFLELLQNPTRLGELLRTLHELGVLEKIIPAFAHARSLLQFNEYHKYTVDEHTLRAVENATRFADRTDVLGEAYNELRDKRLLHLALLIHDLGKGFVEDHSEIGARIALEIAPLFALDEHETEVLRFLVHKHLAMSHLAFRRDTSDPQVILKFAREVGSPEVLSMLYVLTCADLSAVGPGVFNDWKAEVLTMLYQRTLRHLTGDTDDDHDEELREKLYTTFNNVDHADWYRRQIANLPAAYLHSAPIVQLVDELQRLDQLPAGQVRVWSRYLPESHTSEYVIATHENITRGIFHKLTGGLTSQGLQILSADIHTLSEGLVLDRFLVVDPDYVAEPTPDRLERVAAVLQQSLLGDEPPTFRTLWQSSDRRAIASLTQRPAEFHVDNNTSFRSTILDVFANDRRGLLYTITRTLYELGLSVGTAKIGTYLDQVVDVFYVTNEAGEKIEDEAQLRVIRQTVLNAISELEAHT